MAPGRKKLPSAAASSGPRKAWNVGDLVLAKVKGYPAWPAKVSTPEKHKMIPKTSKVFVEYFGTNDLGFVQLREVSEFTPAVRAIIVEKAKSAPKSFKSAVKEICEYVDNCKEKLKDAATKELAEAISSEDHVDDEAKLGADSARRDEGCVDLAATESSGSEDGLMTAVSSGGDATDRGEVVDEFDKKEENADDDKLGDADLLDSFARTACLVLAAETVSAKSSQDLSEGDNDKTFAGKIISDLTEKLSDRSPEEKVVADDKESFARSCTPVTLLTTKTDDSARENLERENENVLVDKKTNIQMDDEDKSNINDATVAVMEEGVEKIDVDKESHESEKQNATDGNENLDNTSGGDKLEHSGAGPTTSATETKILRTYERRKRKLKGDENEKNQENEKHRDEKAQSTSKCTKEWHNKEANTKKEGRSTEKKLLKKSKIDDSEGKNSENDKIKRTISNVTKKLKLDSEEYDIKKHRDRREETLPPSKRQKFLRGDREDIADKEKHTKAVQTTKKTVSLPPRELLDISPVSAAAPPKLFEEDTNKVRAAYEAAKELKQRLAQKEEASSASMKFLKAAAQAKQRTHSNPSTSNRESPLFMRPNSNTCHKASPSQRRNGGEKHVQPKTKDVSKLETFQGMLETLTRSKESISKATRLAMDCANKGLGKKVMSVIMRKLKNERDHKKRVDVLFLVDSLTQYYHQKGTAGRGGYARIVEACLDSFLSAVAPANSPSENRRQCVKVVSLWLKRDIMQESLLKDTMAKLEAGLNTTQRQYQRQDRAIDDPLRGMDDMLVDEYGSNAGFQLPGLLPRQVEEEDQQDAAERRTPVVIEDVDGELEMEDVSPRPGDNNSRDDNSSSSSLTRHEDNEEEFGKTVPLPESSPPPLPHSPPPPQLGSWSHR